MLAQNNGLNYERWHKLCRKRQQQTLVNSPALFSLPAPSVASREIDLQFVYFALTMAMAIKVTCSQCHLLNSHVNCHLRGGAENRETVTDTDASTDTDTDTDS